jgi:hypothetical protein
MELLAEKVITEVNRYPKVRNIATFDYLNVQCRYYDRFLYPELLPKMQDMLANFYQYPKKDIDYYSITSNKELLGHMGCIFIIEPNYEGLYKATPIDPQDSEVINLISNIPNGYSHGGIYFRNNNKKERMTIFGAMRIVEALISLDHCGCFCFTNLYDMTSTTIKIGDKDKTILTLSYDTESG